MSDAVRAPTNRPSSNTSARPAPVPVMRSSTPVIGSDGSQVTIRPIGTEIRSVRVEARSSTGTPLIASTPTTPLMVPSNDMTAKCESWCCCA